MAMIIINSGNLPIRVSLQGSASETIGILIEPGIFWEPPPTMSVDQISIAVQPPMPSAAGDDSSEQEEWDY